jgi:hypothetical protein
LPSFKETTIISILFVPPEIFYGSTVHQNCNDDVIPAAQEAEIVRITVGGQTGQKVNEPPISANKLGVVVGTLVPP